jgi:hypothetical protein
MGNQGHHLILGELEDLITGRPLADTHDERYRQKIARLLIAEKGYLKQDIEPRRELMVQAGEKRAVIRIDFLIKLADRVCMIIRYGPGSIVTRRRPVLAASRLLAGYQIPIAVATNGKDAELLDGASGRVVSSGLETIPTRLQLLEIAAAADFNAISARRAEMESRLVYCYEVDGSCPCDEDVCRL